MTILNCQECGGIHYGSLQCPMGEEAKAERRRACIVRHALGLRDGKTVTFRNYFVAGQGHPDYADCLALTEVGHAVRYEGAKLQLGGDDLFKITRAGALAALLPGESLDREDFPD